MEYTNPFEALYDFPDSLKTTDKLLSIEPNNAEALHTKALILLADGNRTGALFYANEALKYDSKNDARYIKMVATALGVVK
jgi:tetratricopeptide (TPR) repeat protein